MFRYITAGTDSQSEDSSSNWQPIRRQHWKLRTNQKTAPLSDNQSEDSTGNWQPIRKKTPAPITDNQSEDSTDNWQPSSEYDR